MKRGRDPNEDRASARRGRSSDLNKRKRRGRTIQVGAQTLENPFRARVAVPKRALNGVELFFDELEDALVEKIETWGRDHVVVGCVAWLSNPRVLAALRGCRRVLLLVTDEAYARWGGGTCLAQYATLPQLGGTEATPADLFGHFPNALCGLRVAGYQAVRGIAGGTRSLMHAKYLVFFADFAQGELPAAVWTGSFNHTRQAARNIENALFLDSPAAALAYFHDFANSFYESHELRAT